MNVVRVSKYFETSKLRIQMKNEAKNKDYEELRAKWTAESEVVEKEDNGKRKMREGREKERSNAG